MSITPCKELTIKNTYIFQKVMNNSEICKKTIEYLLNKKIKYIYYPKEDKTRTIFVDSNIKQVDVCIDDNKGTILTLYMCILNTRQECIHKIKHCKLFTEIDFLANTEIYEKYDGQCSIFICTFPIFSEQQNKYTFENICNEDIYIHLHDRSKKIFFSTKGENNDMSQQGKNFLAYVDGDTPKDDFVKMLDNEVTKIKQSQRCRLEYIILSSAKQEEQDIGKEEERSEFIERLKNVVNDKLISIEVAAKIADMPVEEFLKKIQQ